MSYTAACSPTAPKAMSGPPSPTHMPQSKQRSDASAAISVPERKTLPAGQDVRTFRILSVCVLPLLLLSVFVFAPLLPSFLRNTIHRIKPSLPSFPHVSSIYPCIPTHPRLQSPSSQFPPLVLDYLHQHVVSRLKLTSRITTSQPPPTLIWQCFQPGGSSCTGVGDRLRGIRFTFLLALYLNRTFFLDWPSHPYPLSVAMSPHLLDWQLPSSLAVDAPLHRDTILLDWQHNSSGGPFSPRRATMPNGTVVDLRRVDLHVFFATLPAVVRVRTVCGRACIAALRINPFAPVGLTSAAAMWNSTNPTLMLERMLMKILFLPSRQTKQRLAMASFGIGEPYVAVHLRTGLDVGEGHIPRFAGARPRTTAAMARGVLRCMRNATLEDGLLGRRLAVASDSKVHRDTLKQLARRRGLIVRAMDGRAMHLSRVGNWRQGIKVQEDGLKNDLYVARRRCEAYVDVFVDLWMMAGAKVLVAMDSTFSEAAFVLGDGQRMFVYRPGVGTACELKESM